MKKTLTPLNDVYMRASQDMARAIGDMFNHYDDAAARQAVRQHAAGTIVPKTTMK
jgi:hypothetical protein